MPLSGPTLLQADPDTGAASSYAAPSSSPTANSGLMAIVLNTDGTNAIRPTFSSAFSVVGSAWTDEGSIQASAATRRYTLFTATATSSPGSGTCTADFAGDAQTGCTIWLLQWTGQDTTDWFINFGTNEGGGSGATSLTLTLPSALSSANNQMVCGVMHNTIEDQTATGGGTELASSEVSYATPNTNGAVYYALNDNSIGASWTTSSAKLAIGGEVVEAIAGGAFDINAEAGAVAVTGTQARTAAGRVVNSTPGTYVLTGAQARTVAGRVVSSTSGAYAVTGFQSRLLAGRMLNVAPGVYAVTGFVADLVHEMSGAFDLNADPGNYAVTGSVTKLVKASIIRANTGTYAVVGVADGHLVQRAILTSPGVYTLTGVVAQLQRTGEIIYLDPIYTGKIADTVAGIVIEDVEE